VPFGIRGAAIVTLTLLPALTATVFKPAERPRRNPAFSGP